MAAKVLKLHIEYASLGEYLWRDIEVSSNSTLDFLGFNILATFDTCAYHQFEFDINGKVYAIPNDEFDIPDTEDMADFKLSDFDFKIGQQFSMDYDYGTTQTFNISVVSIDDMVKGQGRAFPRISAGVGCGIIDDYSEDELESLIQQIAENGKTDEDIFYKDRAKTWNINDYDIKNDNVLLKSTSQIIAESYAPFWENQQ